MRPPMTAFPYAPKTCAFLLLVLSTSTGVLAECAFGTWTVTTGPPSVMGFLGFGAGATVALIFANLVAWVGRRRGVR